MSPSVTGHCRNLEHSRQDTLPSHLVQKLKSDKSDARTSSYVEAWQIFSFLSAILVDFLIANLPFVLEFVDDSCAQIICDEYCRSWQTSHSEEYHCKPRLGGKKWHQTGSEIRSSSAVLTSLHRQRSALSVWSNKTVEFFHFFFTLRGPLNGIEKKLFFGKMTFFWFWGLLRTYFWVILYHI